MYIHPTGRPRCFVFDQSFEFSRFLHRQNQSVQLRLLCICLPPLLFPVSGLTARVDEAKIHIYPEVRNNKQHILFTNIKKNKQNSIFRLIYYPITTSDCIITTYNHRIITFDCIIRSYDLLFDEENIIFVSV